MTQTLAKPHAVVTDIEGTTTPIAYVRDVLFPYAHARIADYVREHIGETAVADIVDAAASQSGRAAADIDGVVVALLGWSAQDAKIGPLKSLQGLIWEDGYRTGNLRAPMFPDAVAGLRRWGAESITLAVYSSGSVLAQKLLFGCSDHGDLCPLFTAFFDTAIGAKRESASYARVADAMKMPPGDILFLSDVAEELDAAQAASVRTVHIVRPGEGATRTDRHPTADSFDEIAWA